MKLKWWHVHIINMEANKKYHKVVSFDLQWRFVIVSPMTIYKIYILVFLSSSLDKQILRVHFPLYISYKYTGKKINRNRLGWASPGFLKLSKEVKWLEFLSRRTVPYWTVYVKIYVCLFLEKYLDNMLIFFWKQRYNFFLSCLPHDLLCQNHNCRGLLRASFT